MSQKKSAKAFQNNETEGDEERATPKKRDISPEKKTNYWRIKISTKNDELRKDTYLLKKDNKLLINKG